MEDTNNRQQPNQQQQSQQQQSQQQQSQQQQSQQQQSQQQAIFSENTNKTLALKGFIAITIFMVLLSVLFCIIVGATENRGELWLLIINLAFSSYVAITLCYWYKQGELESDKAWFLIFVASVLILQTITTDIYVFNPYEEQNPTQAPIITHALTTKKNHTTIKPLSVNIFF
ncbi:uncharacterized protein [Antedon mediterranea]|uniref:uncharacterized protein isoform X1 n=1 Tax=Antedon mediterranea TaxID=105859 RepID=UPI003AF9A812